MFKNCCKCLPCSRQHSTGKIDDDGRSWWKQATGEKNKKKEEREREKEESVWEWQRMEEEDDLKDEWDKKSS